MLYIRTCRVASGFVARNMSTTSCSFGSPPNDRDFPNFELLRVLFELTACGVEEKKSTKSLSILHLFQVICDACSKNVQRTAELVIRDMCGAGSNSKKVPHLVSKCGR